MRSADALVVEGGKERGRLDLGRQVHALLGFAFDAVDLSQTVELLRRRAHDRTPCFLTTANLNFVVTALGDPSFRQTALRSDLCVADGMPILWIARLMGVPIRHRVAGADLFERLRFTARPLSGQTVKVYFFGGPPGAAEAAREKINARAGLLECVGGESPGFGPVETMSQPAQIDRINASGADFLVAAIGAQKGQTWLDRNRTRLNVPLLSYLGAVVNFEADHVTRAPAWMRHAGLEWAWRTAQEPGLWRRYLRDGLVVGRWVVKAILPWRARSLCKTWRGGAAIAASFEVADSITLATYQLRGAWTHDALPPLRRSIADSLHQGREVQLDLSGVMTIDSAVVGLLLVLDAWQQQPRAIKAGKVLDPAVTSALRAFGAMALIDGATEQAESQN